MLEGFTTLSDSENNVKRLLDLDGNSGKLEYDERGFVRFIPSDSEKEKIEAYLKQEVSQAEEAYAQRFADSVENTKAYKAVKEQIDGEAATLPVPLVAIACDQVIADTYNTIVRPRPIISFDAYFDERYQVAVPVEIPDPLTGAPIQTGMPLEKDSEEIAKYIESGFEFKARERFNFPKLAQEIITDVVTDGALPAYVKVCADRSIRTILKPKVDGVTIDLEEKEEYAVKSKQLVHAYTLPKINILKPIGEDDLDSSPWVLERTPVEPETFLNRALGKAREYFLIRDDDDAYELAKRTGPAIPETEEARRGAQKRQDPTPKNRVDLGEVWINWWVKYKDPDTGEKLLKKLSLVGDYHLGAGKLCNLYLNWYDHQQRPIVPFWYIKDPHSDTGSSVADRAKWHQRVLTHAAQAEIKNAFHANNFSYWWDPNSPADEYFAAGKRLRAGEGIPAGKFEEDWGIVRVGAAHDSMLPLMQWCEGAAQRATNVSSYEQGDSVPGRTPAATVSQILAQGKQQPIMFLRTLNDSFVKVVRLFLETERQFQPFGETLPIRNQETKEIMEIPYRFPIGEALDNFRISLTAADEALAKEHEFEQQAIKMQQFIGYSNFVATVAGPMANPMATPATVALFQKILNAAGTLFLEMIEDDRTDEEKFKFQPEIDALVQEAQMARQQMMAAQMGATNAVGANANGGGAVPGAGGEGQPGPDQTMAGSPPDAMGGGPPPTESIPPPPPV